MSLGNIYGKKETEETIEQKLYKVQGFILELENKSNLTKDEEIYLKTHKEAKEIILKKMELDGIICSIKEKVDKNVA